MNDLDIVEYLLEGTIKKELVIVDIQPDYKKYITFNGFRERNPPNL